VAAPVVPVVATAVALAVAPVGRRPCVPARFPVLVGAPVVPVAAPVVPVARVAVEAVVVATVRSCCRRTS
jgi:hypothetical protein